MIDVDRRICQPLMTVLVVVAIITLAVLTIITAPGCASAPPLKADGVQAGLQAGMTACDVLRADPTIEREPSVDALCRRVVEGCPR